MASFDRGWRWHTRRDPKCPFIVAWKGQGIVETKTAWNKARERAGVPNLLIHDLRRTAARNMIRAGVPEKQVLLIVGWKTRAMLNRYNITDERDVQLAGEKLARFLESGPKSVQPKRKSQLRNRITACLFNRLYWLLR
jgi:integrase